MLLCIIFNLLDFSVLFSHRRSAQKLQGILDNPIIVENHAGAGGNIASNIVAKAAPDGYKILITPSLVQWPSKF